MTATEYKHARQSLGLKQTDLAKKLGVNRFTITRRENGYTPINREAELAIECLKFKHHHQR